MTQQATPAGAAPANGHSTETGPDRSVARRGVDSGPSRRRRRAATAPPLSIYLFPLPALVVFVIFFMIPTLQAFQYAITDWNGYSADFNWVGLDNFKRALVGDSLFHNALFNNLKFLLVVLFVQTTFSLILALALLRNTRIHIALRALFFFPTILSSVSVAFVWKFIYDPSYGLGNSILGGISAISQAIGLDVDLTSSFLGNDALAIYWIALAQCWAHIGQLMVIYIAGLQAIPAELYEAAEMDGAGRWQRFWNVTWPQLAAPTGIVMAYTTVQSFKAFDLILGLSGIPPKGSTDILSTRIYTTFANSQYGYAAAESVIFMILIGVITWLQRRAIHAVHPSED
ncbi:sugar ABC transporter permease [Brachybacterium sp. Marseille-Q7125]|uniref:carbohydrate ABC transporter permease n=1 Tax=Brachybacterium sp. Marseille-Q7125 TaxID=2932815 RepID=UPI001FF69DE7|nr:sugar ABC transporter permease [Brachybacterium sp. Marseille-Q7125]